MEEGQRDMDADTTRDPEAEDEELPSLPESLIPRWLAAVVLVLLFASGVATTWLVLTG